MALFDQMIRQVPGVAAMSATIPLCVLAGVGFSVLLLNSHARGKLANKRTLILTVLLFIPWLLLVPYAAVWSDVENRHHLGLWPVVPNWAVLLSWPVLAYHFRGRMHDAQGTAMAYIFCNAPGCLFTWFITTIIVSADWI